MRMAGDHSEVGALICRRRRRREPNQQPLASCRRFPNPIHSPRRRPHRVFFVSRRSPHPRLHLHLLCRPPHRAYPFLKATRAWRSDGTREPEDPTHQQLRQTWKPPRPLSRARWIESPFEFPLPALVSLVPRFVMRDAWFVSQGERHLSPVPAAPKCWHPCAYSVSSSHLRSRA